MLASLGSIAVVRNRENASASEKPRSRTSSSNSSKSTTKRSVSSKRRAQLPGVRHRQLNRDSLQSHPVYTSGRFHGELYWKSRNIGRAVVIDGPVGAAAYANTRSNTRQIRG